MDNRIKQDSSQPEDFSDLYVNSGFIGSIFYTWVYPLIRHANKKKGIESDTVFITMSPSQATDYLSTKIEKSLIEERK